nr:reverse transcriptase domain-containing protein [Tanacetum cinerariifolium]
MSQPANPTHTPAISSVRNTAGKGSKQTPSSNSGCLPTDKLREICEKHYNQILPIMAEKVHQEKLQGLQTRMTYDESSHRNLHTQFSVMQEKEEAQEEKTKPGHCVKRDTSLADRKRILQAKARNRQTNPSKKPSERYSVH